MSTVQEIEAAIRCLTPNDRGHLFRDLPELFPELEVETAWWKVIRDPRPRPALSALLDEVDAVQSAKPDAFPEIKESDFELPV